MEELRVTYWSLPWAVHNAKEIDSKRNTSNASCALWWDEEAETGEQQEDRHQWECREQ